MKIIKQLQSRFPNWSNFNKNLTRNYPMMVVGGSEAYYTMRKLPQDLNKILNLSLPAQNLYMCFEVIKHFYSITRNGGSKIYVLLKQKELEAKVTKKALPFHYSVLHHWLYPNTRSNKLKMRFHIVFQPIWTLKCLGIEIPEYSKAGDIGESIKLIKDIQEFLLLRSREFTLVLIGDYEEQVLKLMESAGVSFVSFSSFTESNELKCENNK